MEEMKGSIQYDINKDAVIVLIEIPCNENASDKVQEAASVALMDYAIAVKKILSS